MQIYGVPRQAALVATWDSDQEAACSGATRNTERSRMNLLDLAKATIICGGVAFVVYSFPVVVKFVIIGLLSLLWLAYAYKTLETLRRRWLM